MSKISRVITRSNMLKRLVVKVEWQEMRKEHHAADLAEALSWMKMYPIGAKIEVSSKFSNKVLLSR